MSDTPAAPPGKQVVVVREGPSKKRPIIIDAAVGLVGLLLLLGSVALVDVLPEEEPVVPQYKAVFVNLLPDDRPILDVETGEKFASTVKYTTPGQTVTWELEFQENNIYQVDVNLYLSDDHPATLPDFFSVELESPNGTIYEYTVGDGLVETLPTMVYQNNTGTQFYVDAGTGRELVSSRILPVPRDFIFTTENLLGEPGDFELFEIRDALREQYTVTSTPGVWKVHVTMESAGHCPELDPGGDTNRASQCPIQNLEEGADPSDPAQDAGNPVRLSQISYFRYVIGMEEA